MPFSFREVVIYRVIMISLVKNSSLVLGSLTTCSQALESPCPEDDAITPKFVSLD